MIGSIASAKTTVWSGHPNLLNFVAILNPKLEALRESAAALASEDAANQTREREAQNKTQKTNLVGFSSENGANISVSSDVPGNPSERNAFSEVGGGTGRPGESAFDLRGGIRAEIEGNTVGF